MKSCDIRSGVCIGWVETYVYRYDGRFRCCIKCSEAINATQSEYVDKPVEKKQEAA